MKPWTKQEIEFARAWKKEGVSEKVIAARLYRDEVSVHSKLVYEARKRGETPATAQQKVTPPVGKPLMEVLADTDEQPVGTLTLKTAEPVLVDAKGQPVTHKCIGVDLAEPGTERQVTSPPLTPNPNWVTPPTSDEDLTPEQIAELEKDKSNFRHWRKLAKDYEKRLNEVSDARTAIEILVDQVEDLAPVSYSAAPPIATLNTEKAVNGSPQSAVCLLSDTHIGAVVRPEQTLGFGGYNFGVFLRRLKRLEESILSILHDHTTTAVPELVVPILGDCLDGSLQHSAECGQVNTVFTQCYNAGHALAQFLRNLSAHVPKVRVYTAVGNHTRWGTQKKMPTKNRFSNFDHFLYAYIQALIRDIPTIEFHLNQQPFAEFEVQGHTFLAGHGEHLRGGDKALGIPAHALGRNVSIESQLRAKFGRNNVKYYCFGHLHRPMELPHSQGEILINGAFTGLDEYAFMEKFAALDPIQKFFLVHPRFGRSACYDLNLKYAATEGTPYQLPTAFPIQ